MERIEKLYQSVNMPFIIANPSNIFYFTDYDNCDSKIVACKGKYYYITDSRYTEEAKLSIPSCFEVIEATYARIFPTIGELLSDEKTVGYDLTNLYHSDYLSYVESLPCKELVSIDSSVISQRAIKDEQEIEFMRRAGGIADFAYAKVLKCLKEGVSEREIKTELDYYMLKEGASGIAFETIVAFGENSSKPHCHSGDRKLKVGDVVLMDFGAKFHGYCSDMTRCVAFGNASSKVVDIYNKVLQANLLGLDAVKSGVDNSIPHFAAVDYFKQFALDSYFIHSLGHGVGVDIHEYPGVNRISSCKLQKNNIVTVEPGLYFPSEFGIRIEDMVVVTENAPVILNNTSKKLIIL